MNLFIFHVATLAGIGNILWNKYKSHMVVSILSMMLLPKEQPPSISKAERTISNTMLIPYHYNDKEYTMVVPIKKTKRKLNWSVSIAHLDNGEKIDVTNELKPMAGPNGDFMSMKLDPHQLVRGAKTIHFYQMKGSVQKRVFSFE